MILRKQDDEAEGSSSQDEANDDESISSENRKFSGSPPGQPTRSLFPPKKKASHQCQRVIVSDKVSTHGKSNE